MSARNGLLILDGSDGWPAQVDAILARHRTEVLAEAIEAVQAKALAGSSDVMVAHRSGITDSIAAIVRLTEGGAERASERAAVLAEVADMLMAADETAAALLVDRLRDGGEQR